MRQITTHVVPGDPAPQVTIVVLDEPADGGACHQYSIEAVVGSGKNKCLVPFQKGPIKEVGVNGVPDVALLAVLIDRLEGFQAGPFRSEYNEEALFHARQMMHLLHQRTRDRPARGVEGESKA